jgi:hypothetical protein
MCESLYSLSLLFPFRQIVGGQFLRFLEATVRPISRPRIERLPVRSAFLRSRSLLGPDLRPGTNNNIFFN